MIKEQINLVEQFHKTFNHPIGEFEKIINEKNYNFRINFLREELHEINKACGERHLVELADGLCDFQYVLYGFIIESGMQERFISLMSKIDNSIFGIEKREPCIPEYDIWNHNILSMTALLDVMNRYCIAHDTKNLLMSFFDMQYIINDFIRKSEMKDIFNDLFSEVQRSNMSKACISEEEANETIKSLEWESYMKPIGDYFVVYRKSDDKVMKNINYSKVNFSKILK